MPIYLILAAVAPGAASAEPPVVIDLLIPQTCAQTDEAILQSEIVVCGERERQPLHRLNRIDPVTGRSLPKAEVQLADGTSLAAETESADLGMARSQRAMVRLKLKF